MAQWVRICSLVEAPKPGKVMEAAGRGLEFCLANVRGELLAIENLCPHREGPLGQGWIEGDLVICPWHSWAFNAKTGVSEYPADESVEVYPVRIEGEDVVVEIRSFEGNQDRDT